MEDHLSQRIETLISEYCNNLNERPYLRNHAEKHQVLPIFVDWVAFYGLRKYLSWPRKFPHGPIDALECSDCEGTGWLGQSHEL